MKTSFEMLLELKERYPLYIERKSFRQLIIYINGYEKCLMELFGGREESIINSSKFDLYVRGFFKKSVYDTRNHNWKEVLLYESHTDENAFDVFYRIVDSYMTQEINIRNQELERQKRYHQFQLDTNFEKVRPAEDYLTSGTMLEFLERGKKRR